jgi:hypothetical protein
MFRSIKSHGTGGRPSNVAARGDWLVVRQLDGAGNGFFAGKGGLFGQDGIGHIL